MLYKILQYVIALLVGVMGFVAVDEAMPLLSPIIDAKFLNAGFFGISVVKVLAFVVGGIIGGILGYMLSNSILRVGISLSGRVERVLSRVPSEELISGTLGLLIGLIIANLIGVAFEHVPIVGPYIPIVLSAILGYVGLRLMIRKGPALYAALLAYFGAILGRKAQKGADTNETSAGGTTVSSGAATAVSVAASRGKLLDTSVVIDGRIAELCKTGFLEGPLIAPLFMLAELQHISDSSDSLKRNRGRRGLDILQAMRDGGDVEVIVVDDDYEDIEEVDSKLMRLALEKSYKLVTNDFNLNKVARLQGIDVLNLNELANAMKPSLVAGERMRVQVIKEGKEDRQGIAYMDDGTMIVIENGAEHVNSAIDVMVTSVFQTNAGRMIFARV